MSELRTKVPAGTYTGCTSDYERLTDGTNRVRQRVVRSGTTQATIIGSEAERLEAIADLQALAAPLPVPDPVPPPPPPPPPPAGTITLVTRMGALDKVTSLQAGKTYERVDFLGLVVLGAGTVLHECRISGYGGNTPINPPDVQCWLDGGGAKLLRCQVRDNQYHAGVYVDADDCVVEDCHLLNNGGRDSNRSHGLYFDAGARGVVRSNLIEGSMAYGVQAYPGPRDLRIEHNLIRTSGNAGVILGGEGGKSATNVSVTDNWFDYNQGGVVTTYNLTGSGCSADRNYATGNTPNTYSGSNYTKGSLTSSAPPSSWAVPQPLVFIGP